MRFSDLNQIFILDYLNYFKLIQWSVVIILFIYFYDRRRQIHNSLKGIPTWKLRFWHVFGHAQLSLVYSFGRKKLPYSTHVYDFQSLLGFTVLFQKTGLIYLWQAFTPCVMVYKADSVKAILTHSTELRKSWFYGFIHNWIGTGLLTSEGKKWRQRRKLLTPTFHSNILKDFLPCLNNQCKILVTVLQKEIEKPCINIVPFLTLCSLDIICDTILGIKAESQMKAHSKYVKAVLELSEGVFKRALSPWYWPEATFRLSSYGRNVSDNIEIVHKFTRQIIAQKKSEKIKNRKDYDPEVKTDGIYHHRERRALLDFLIEAHLKGEAITEEDIREEIDTFTFEGHDTTSMGMSWAVYLIGLHPEVQENLQDELKSIFGDDQDRPITVQDLTEMRYLERALKESLRLYPSVPFFSRDLIEDTEINGRMLKKGTTCGVYAYGLHRDPTVFPNPEKFDPDRFLPGCCEGRDPFAYVPFSAGPRNCIGQRFAMMELKTVVATICRNFHIRSLDPRDQVYPVNHIILRADTPIRIKLRNKHFL